MSVIKVTDLDLKGKRVFIRADLNVPVKDGKVTSDARITASMATINHCLEQGAKVMVTSHLGRPEEGVWSERKFTQAGRRQIAARLEKPVRLIRDWVDENFEIAEGELVVLENCRINKGEKKNSDETAQKYAQSMRRVCDGCFRHSAPRSSFDLWYRQICSCCLCRDSADGRTGCANQGAPEPGAPHGCDRRRFEGLHKAYRTGIPFREGGSNGRWRRYCQYFSESRGKNVGKSLCEDDLVPTAKMLMEKMAKRHASIPIAVDVVVGKKFDANEPAVLKDADAVADDE